MVYYFAVRFRLYEMVNMFFSLFQEFNGKDRVRLWIEHLCGCAATGTEPFESLFVCNDKSICMPSPFR